MARFKNRELSRIFILLGITVHWTLVVVDDPTDPHLYYLDSVNYPLERILAEDYSGIAIEEKTLDYFRDLRRALKILSDMALRSINITLVKFEGQLSEMLVSFAMVDQTSEKEVRKWFQEEYHPAVIKNDVVQPMSGCDLSKANPLLLREFYRFLAVAERYNVFDVGDLLKTLSPYK
ncbi:MAG: hypothetical protein JST59_00275 [Actinobacteria bacterium]|nr:hypothetical protein [Actinomycetota bacterium]